MRRKMTKTVCVFPGQGSQTVGMGKSLFDNFACAKLVFNEVDDALNQHLSKIIFEGSEADLTLTENAQPAIMATSIAALRVLETEGGFDIAKHAHFVAGHSLGEYSALAAAKALTLSDTAKLLKLRGTSMQQAVPAGQGTMAAILGLDMAQVEAITAQASANGDVCDVANDNSNGQVVISGSRAGVEKAMLLAKEAGAKRAIELNVSAPFHCSLMQPAAEAMKAALAQASVSAPVVPVIANVTALPTNNPNEIRDLLVQQVTGRVRWNESVLWMGENGVSRAIEIGEGNVLAGLIRRIAKEIVCQNFSKPEDLSTFSQAA
jgi:[acyl-carrier-protein] S-malonyltransferase